MSQRNTRKPTARTRARRSDLAVAQADWRQDDERLVIQLGELSSTLDSLAAMVCVLRRTGGYLEHVDQVALRAAEAKLAQHGRSVDR